MGYGCIPTSNTFGDQRRCLQTVWSTCPNSLAKCRQCTPNVFFCQVGRTPRATGFTVAALVRVSDVFSAQTSRQRMDCARPLLPCFCLLAFHTASSHLKRKVRWRVSTELSARATVTLPCSKSVLVCCDFSQLRL